MNTIHPRPHARYVLLVAVCGLTACAEGLAARTYPPTSDLPEITTDSLVRITPAIGAFNIRAVVRSLRDCPNCPGCNCMPDAIMVSDSPADSPVAVEVHAPRQFDVGKRYLLSVTLGGQPPNQSVQAVLVDYAIVN